MNIEDARSLVFHRKPELGSIYETFKDNTWISYAKSAYVQRPLTRNDRTTELLDAFTAELAPLVGHTITRQAADTLMRTGFASTADHQGILCHPFFSNAALLRHITRTSGGPVISLSCGGISLNNSSYPRGIFFHDAALNRIRIPFVSLHDRHLPVYGHVPIPKNMFIARANLSTSLPLPPRVRSRLGEFFTALTNEKSIWNQHSLSEQFTIMNMFLWNFIFGAGETSLVYLEAESLVRRLLLDYHMDSNTPIHSILFDPATTSSYLHAFEGVSGAHSGITRGSHLFWHIERKNRSRRALYYDSNRHGLVSADKSVAISLSRNGIAAGLESFALLPTTALSYSLLAFYYGLTLGGGFSQIQYLGDMKRAYDSVFSIKTDVPTTIFSGEFCVTGITNGRNTVPATLIDLLLWGGNDTGERIEKAFSTVTVGQSLDAMLPEFLAIIDKSKSLATNPPVPGTFHVAKE